MQRYNTPRFLLALIISLSSLSVQADTSPDDARLQPLIAYHDAMSYLLGRNGKPKSAEKAAELFQQLAEQNWRSAQQMLGHLYYEGKGVEQNKLLAYKWLSLAARDQAYSEDSLNERRRQLKNQLPVQSLHQVERWIAEWQPEI